MGSAHKRNSLNKLLYVHKPKVMLIQESLSKETKVKGLLMVAFPGWNFEVIIIKGRFGGLVLGWYKYLQSRNISFLPSKICVALYSLEVGIVYNVINILVPTK
jgi:hypothetical protein